MRRLALLVAISLLTSAGLAGLLPRPAAAARWGSSYGDPSGFCPAQSLLPASYTSVVTNDPLVGSNPEQNTFWGIHQYPGYDEWYGYWYGDFRGSPGDASGWQHITTSWYGSPPGHWNFASWGWAVHGHAKQYIAYYNWTFGGQCGMGWYGAGSPPPYMADVYGYPVVDIYVDSVPPNPPAPRVTATTTTSVSFTWDPVTDRGDGAGPDYYVSGFDHFTSWLTVDGGAPQQLASTAAPRALTASGLGRGAQACVHVIAADRLGNQTGDQSVCARALAPPLLPPPPQPVAVGLSPAPVGLTGLDTWFWLKPAPTTTVVTEGGGSVTYTITEVPTSVRWVFGDGSVSTLAAPAGFGTAYPAQSPVTHTYETQSPGGYAVSASVGYSTSWTAVSGGAVSGPYPLATRWVAATGIVYPVEQAQSEITDWR